VDGVEDDALHQPEAVEAIVSVLGKQEQCQRLPGLLWTQSAFEEQALYEGGSGAMDGVRKSKEEIVNGGGELNHWEYGLSVARDRDDVCDDDRICKQTHTVNGPIGLYCGSCSVGVCLQS